MDPHAVDLLQPRIPFFPSSLLSSRDDVWEGTDGATPDLADLFGKVR